MKTREELREKNFYYQIGYIDGLFAMASSLAQLKEGKWYITDRNGQIKLEELESRLYDNYIKGKSNEVNLHQRCRSL